MKKDKAEFGRRDFLRVMGAGAGLAATAAAVTTFTAGEAVAEQSDADKKKARYNPNSEDVKNYYRVNRD